jgi:hypothetical protein
MEDRVSGQSERRAIGFEDDDANLVADSPSTGTASRRSRGRLIHLHRGNRSLRKEVFYA